MMSDTFNVLFLCTGNSARSIMGEAIMNRVGEGKLRAFSAGSQPKGEPNPNTLKLLAGLGYDTTGYRSKSWSEFAAPGAPQMDFIFTVCDDAAGETCPVWPGKPMTAHWGVPDPAAVTGSEMEIARAFQEAYGRLYRRIELFAALPIKGLSELALRSKLKEIGKSEGATAQTMSVE
ncbi:MAG TPA: arsenate reductase ArsC [Xanthobacteraceae bacterium]|nr:arsenate reductase ArsC [Xanthobacteraceae bacterium]